MPTLTTKRLTRAQADAIVRAVTGDADCKKQIGSSYWSYLPPGLKLAGSFRNVTNLFKTGQLFDPRTLLGLPMPPMDVSETLDICQGISKATAAAIGRAQIAGVGKTDTCDRSIDGTAHQATLVHMAKMGAVVFDWHATLRVENPIIYRTLPDWQKDQDGEVYSTFKGF